MTVHFPRKISLEEQIERLLVCFPNDATYRNTDKSFASMTVNYIAHPHTHIQPVEEKIGASWRLRIEI